MRGLRASPLAEHYRLDVVPTHRGPGAARRLVVFFSALLRLIWWSLRGRGRIVHVHATVRGSMYRKAVCVLLAKALRRLVVLHMHSGPGDIGTFRAGLGRGSLVFLRFAFRIADVVIAVSAASAAALTEAFSVGDILVIPNPAPAGPTELEREDRDSDPLALYLGGFANPVKGGEVLLAALERPELTGLRFFLAGPGELPVAGDLLRPGVEWRGWLEAGEKEAALREAAIFVLPSTSEGLPMALLEAMSYGLAIVATGVGGVPDVARDGIDALIVPPGDPAALAAALARLADDAELRHRLGSEARAQARRNGPAPVAARIDSLYRQLLGTADAATS